MPADLLAEVDMVLLMTVEPGPSALLLGALSEADPQPMASIPSARLATLNAVRRFMVVLPIVATMLFAACSDDTPVSGDDLPGDRGGAVTDDDAASDATDASDARADVSD